MARKQRAQLFRVRLKESNNEVELPRMSQIYSRFQKKISASFTTPLTSVASRPSIVVDFIKKIVN